MIAPLLVAIVNWADSSTPCISFENDHATLAIGPAAELRLVANETGRELSKRDAHVPWATATKGGESCRVASISPKGNRLILTFEPGGVQVALGVACEKRYFVVEVLSVSDSTLDELTFVDIPLTLTGGPDEPPACCALALNLRTNVPELPGPAGRLRATCYRRFGMVGAKVALIACPQEELREVMKEVVSNADALPHSPLGGPWALDAEINRRSYLIDYPGSMSLETVDEWIRLAKALGVGQVDLHSGQTMRYGDYEPNPEIYPNGCADLKAAIDRLHEAGILAGLHTYAFFIGKDTPWVTPVADPRLAKDAGFTLANPLDATETTVPVIESTAEMSTVTGFQIRNSVTLQIDDELITYSGISREPPYAFTECSRGACGTRVASHEAGTPVHHLKECFGLFAPDADSTLFQEVAAGTAEVYNTCGFDMIYLDALDGSDLLAGPENAWYYGSQFVFELWKRLERPALIEMSTFHHHLWYVRSRIGAWDVAQRGTKRFIDLHCTGNESAERMFLPTNLGWSAVFSFEEVQRERTLPDTVEYLCCKSLGYASSLSWLLGFDPQTFPTSSNQQRLARIVRQYEELRLSRHFPEAVLEQLRVPGEEFSLEKDAAGEWQFQRVRHAAHTVRGMDGWSNAWTVANPFEKQPVRFRIEALMSAAPYDSPDSIVLAGCADPGEFAEPDCAEGVTAGLGTSEETFEPGAQSLAYSALNGGNEGNGAWAGVSKTFSPYLDMLDRQGIGVWICGDGQGEVLNFQTRCPVEAAGAIGERYVDVDFSGWRYIELIEPEGDRLHEFRWPYANGLYRIWSDYRRIHSIGLWYNNLPPGKSVRCVVGPIKALPLEEVTLENPTITVGNRRLELLTYLQSGQYLEYRPFGDCSLYDADGELLGQVDVEGEAPMLEQGDNRVDFACGGTPAGLSARARVTVVIEGPRIGLPDTEAKM